MELLWAGPCQPQENTFEKHYKDSLDSLRIRATFGARDTQTLLTSLFRMGEASMTAISAARTLG